MIHRRPFALLAAAGIVAGALLVGPAATAGPSGMPYHEHGRATPTLVPIGSGYEADTERQFARVVAGSATGRTVDILVVPSSYGDDPADRQTNLVQAHSRRTATATAENSASARITRPRRLLPTTGQSPG